MNNAETTICPGCKELTTRGTNCLCALCYTGWIKLVKETAFEARLKRDRLRFAGKR